MKKIVKVVGILFIVAVIVIGTLTVSRKEMSSEENNSLNEKAGISQDMVAGTGTETGKIGAIEMR